MRKNYDQFFEGFKLHFPSISCGTVKWEPKGKSSILVYLSDGTKVIYNHKLNCLRNVLEYEGTEDEWKREFSFKLVELMADKGLDQLSLSELSGISQVSISNYINGRSIPNGYKIEKIARALKCSVRDLIVFD